MNTALNSERKGEGMELSFVWEEKEGGVSLLGVYGDTPSPVIPDRIENRPVIEIGRYCFASRKRHTKPVILMADGGLTAVLSNRFGCRMV